MSAHEHLLRRAEAAKYVGSRNKLDELVADGTLDFHLVNKERRFRLGDLIEWQEGNRRSKNPAQAKEHTRDEMRAEFARCKAAALSGYK